MLTIAVQVLVDLLAVVGGWSLGGTAGRLFTTRRARRTSRQRDVSPFPALVPWQYDPAAFERPTTESETTQ